MAAGVLTVLLVAVLAFSAASALLPAQAAADRPAAAGPWAENGEGRVRLIAARTGLGQSQDILLGLHFQLVEGWKIYWRSPGDAGLPPEVNWAQTKNLETAEIAWPLPHRFSLFGLETFGYGGEVVLPIRARAADPGQPLSIDAKLDYLVCEEICIPHTVSLGLTLPAAGGGDAGRPADLIREALQQVPGDGTDVGLRLERAVLTGEPRQPSLQVVARSQTPFEAADVMVEGPPGFGFGKPETRIADGGKKAVLTLPVHQASNDRSVLEGKPITLTLADPARGIGMEATVIARHAEASSGGEGGLATLAGMLGLALLGGLILNLMPCVLPVLSIKLLSAVSHGGRASGEVRLSFLASAAGIVTSFLVLAGGLIALKSAGLAVGWGIQFQQPVFLSAMALIVTLFSLNLLGMFEIRLPAGLNDAVADAGDPAHGHHRHSLGGAFLTGAFATLLATPCSAPFLGTAVGFALSRGTAQILLIFAALGLGLALPYLAVAAVPRLATRLPRPGPWMIWLKRVLALALAGTAVWLLSVLWQQSGPAAALAAAALLAGIGLAFWLLGRQRQQGRRALPAAVAVLGAAVLAVPLLLEQGPSGNRLAEAQQTDGWRTLDEAAIARLVNDGKVVFVDVTADWCITCQVNKRLVIDDGAVQQRLERPDVVTMRGDWTRPNEEIARYLRGFGRYGIPFNAVYGPGAPEGVALPEILSVGAVMRAMDKAAGNQRAQAGGG
ncbi:MAG: protein-disulfide reductase DsbD family protein [Rhodovibrionaceae bacterium]|nr:protein-disulfide reductase DsbD family protein [Rhodovibrionaceae bacterium]